MKTQALAACAALALAFNAQAADKVKIGFVSTLSGPSAALGVDIRDGFQLAVKMNGG
ncbi:MAG TPA: ABC transporter substrate-binding protein, partial [Burkholderiales bacterium]|nr:ABC transporter substrate-binding protein [Burkholderiales bacterium]